MEGLFTTKQNPTMGITYIIRLWTNNNILLVFCQYFSSYTFIGKYGMMIFN